MPHVSELLYCLVVAVALAAECLVIAWSATSDRPRLLRALIVWIAISLLIPIRAYLPALVLTMTAALTWKLVAVIGRWQRMSAGASEPATVWWRFQLGDVFVLILFVATVAALFRQFPHFRFMAILYLPVLGLPLAPILALSHFAVAGRDRLRMAAAALIAIVASASIVVMSDLAQQLQFSFLTQAQTYFMSSRFPVGKSILLAAILTACFALAIWLAKRLWARPPEWWKRALYGLALAGTAAFGLLLACRYIDELLLRNNRGIGLELLWVALNTVPLICLALLVAYRTWLNGVPGDPPGTLRRVSRWIAIAVATVVAVPIAGLYWEMVRPLPFPPPRVAGENHYDRIEAICLELGAPSAQGSSFNNDTTRALVEEAVTLLDATNFLPASALEEDARPAYPRRVSARALNALPIHFEAAAKFASYPGNFDRATDYSLAGLRYGEMFHRGGTAGYASFASGLQGRSLQWLAEHRDHVSPAKAREIVESIERAFLERDSYETLEARQLISWERSPGWMGRLKYRLWQWFPPKVATVPWQRDEYLASSASLRALQTVFAFRLFQDDHRRLPQSLAELTPDYLHTVPLDPYSNSPLIYRSTADGFTLYSVGRDRIDDGGKFDAINYHRTSDYDLDVSWNDARSVQ